MFPESIAEKYRVVRTQHGTGEQEAEWSIPLGSWRKGRDLEGSRGHVYEYGPGWAGVWIKGRRPETRIAALAVPFSNLRIMQVSDQEATFRVPSGDLEALLPILNAKRLRRASEAAKKASAKGWAASPLSKRRSHRPEPELGTLGGEDFTGLTT